MPQEITVTVIEDTIDEEIAHLNRLIEEFHKEIARLQSIRQHPCPMDGFNEETQ